MGPMYVTTGYLGGPLGIVVMVLGAYLTVGYLDPLGHGICMVHVVLQSSLGCSLRPRFDTDSPVRCVTMLLLGRVQLLGRHPTAPKAFRYFWNHGLLG